MRTKTYTFTATTKLIILLAFLTGSVNTLCSQTVGLVLSGGGAAGMSHLGVIKALEENDIPINYITGTSAGALVGSLYCSGYSPEQLIEMVQTDQFQMMANGGTEPQYKFVYKKPIDNASWLRVNVSKNFKLANSIPTNFTNPTLIDFQLMELFSGVNAKINNNFDSLFIPFRCVASDVANKDIVVFKEGHVNQAVRASMSFPFYLKPIQVDGKLLFDGGLYNNFPTDVMYDDFLPDIVIGVNLSDTMSLPDPDDVISQLKSMVISRDDYSLICENGILIDPNTEVSTFGWNEVDRAILDGYNATIAKMDEIKASISARISKSELDSLRAIFRSDIEHPSITDVKIIGLNEKQKSFVKKNLFRKKEALNYKRLKSRYYRIISDNKIDFMYPLAIKNKTDSNYTLQLEVREDNDLKLEFGGNFSSKPINTGFIGAHYKWLGRTAVNAYANSYFGKFYGSVNGRVRFDFPFDYPFFVELEGTLNRWDYFKSSATFFEDVKPSFVVQNEQFAGVNLGSPIGNNGKIELDYRGGRAVNQYHQSTQFLSTDTTDVTSFDFHSAGLSVNYNTLNKKFWANEGMKVRIWTRAIIGSEALVPGSQANTGIVLNKEHGWILAGFEWDNYFKVNSHFKIGINLQATYGNQDYFANYISSKLMASIYEPIPETKALFLEKYRNNKFGSAGLKLITSFGKNFDLRFENYYYQPYEAFYNVNNTPVQRQPFDGDEWISSASIVYHSPIAPVSFTVNHYSGELEPWSFVFNLGYLIFNKRAFN